MAKRKPTGTDNRQTMDKFSYRQDTVTGEWYRSVCDEITHGKLDQVIAGVGGGLDTTVTIYNVNIINAGVEQSQVLPANTKYFLIRSRNKGQVRLAYALGGTNTTYLTIPNGSSYTDEQFYIGATIYFQSTKLGDVIEIVAYS